MSCESRASSRSAAKTTVPAKPASRARKIAATSKPADAPSGAAPAAARRKPAKGGLAAPQRLTGKDPVARSLKAPSPRAATYRGKGRAPEMAAPLDLVPSALRVNPVKSAPGSLAIQGHVSSNVRRQQGKRDSR